MEARIFADTRDMPREQWLKLRRKGLGGSDAAALMGMSRYATPYSVWADKAGLTPEKEDTEAMRQGRELEEYVAQRFTQETGIKVRRRNAILQSAQHPFMLANIDRECVGLGNIRAGLECKTTRDIYLRRFKDGEFPDEYYCQCMHYLAVTGWDRWYLAVLVYGTDFMVFQIDRDEDEIRALIEAEERFWLDFETGRAPAVDGLAPTGDAIQAVYPEGSDTEALDLGCLDALSSYMALTAQIKLLDVERERRKQQIQVEMAEHELGRCGRYTVKWRAARRRTLDIKRYEADNGPIPDEYFSTSSSRRFEVKEAK